LWTIAVLLCVVVPSVGAQVQQSGSLADAARQARAQKQGQSQANLSAAQQVADELSEDQNDSDAPSGFKTYNAGDYKVWVPAPYKVDGNDDAGTVLSVPNMGSKHALILLAKPVALTGENGDAAFHDAATQFAHVYSQSARCTRTTLGNHEAYQCKIEAANLLGQRVSGNAIFLRGSGNVYPVFCLSPTDSRARDIVNDPHSTPSQKTSARQTLDLEKQDTKDVWQKCDSVFQSVRVKEVNTAQESGQAAVQPATASGTPSGPTVGPGAPAQAGKTASTGGNERASAGAPASLADIARRLKQDPGQPAEISPAAQNAAPGSTVPAGFKVQAFQYCAAVHQCWDASVLIPVDAQLISSDCKQYAFEIKVQGSPFLLMAGPAGGDCDGRSANDASLVRWKELVDPDSRRAPGTYSTISSQTRKLDGKAAAVITIGFRKGLTEWMGKRAEVENNGIQVVVGCMAPREHFADGDAVCSALIESLRLP